MSLVEITLFLAQTMNTIIMSFDSVYLGSLSILDIFLSVIYLNITLWGLFSLIKVKGTKDIGSDTN